MTWLHWIVTLGGWAWLFFDLAYVRDAVTVVDRRRIASFEDLEVRLSDLERQARRRS